MKRFANIRTTPALAGVLLSLSLTGCAPGGALTAPARPSGAASVSVSEAMIAAGLKEALRIGVERAVADSARDGGFLDNPLLRIALPDELDGAVDTLRTLGLGGLVDGFEASMNHAAERAVATAAPAFAEAIGAMTLADVDAIYRGGPTAATHYFRARTETALRAGFKPVIERQMARVGVYRLYQDLITPYRQLPFASAIDLDLADYLTDRALDGLFLALGQEEARIRRDPLARTTDLLRRVFAG